MWQTDMTSAYVLQERQDHLLAIYDGPFSIEHWRQCIDQMRERCNDTGLRHVLLDCRAISGELSILSRYQVVDYGTVLLGLVNRIALLVREETLLPDRFVENVAVNRGLNLKVFTESAAAEAWLAAETAAPSADA